MRTGSENFGIQAESWQQTVRTEDVAVNNGPAGPRCRMSPDLTSTRTAGSSINASAWSGCIGRSVSPSPAVSLPQSFPSSDPTIEGTGAPTESWRTSPVRAAK
jgi:hypothetical protein